MSINFNLHDHWVQNLFGAIQHNRGGQAGKITAVDIVEANLCCKFVQPPPKFIAAALTANVTYQTSKFMRFRCENSTSIICANGQTSRPGYAWPQETVEFTLNAVNFPYMPSIFMIEVGPDYNEKLNYVAAADSGINADFVEMSKEDRRFGICGLDLIVNTSPDVVPDRGKGDSGPSNIVHLRYNIRELYNMYLKNSSSLERAIYDFDTWYQRGCCVLISSADMNGILPSCHIRGNVSIQGRIRAVNTLGYKCYIGNATAREASGQGAEETAVQDAGSNHVCWIEGQKYEKFDCSITGVYANQYMALDAKSGIVGESVLSEQYGNSMRLSTGQ